MSTTLPISTLPVMDEGEASEAVREIFSDIKRKLDIPFVPNIHRAIASSPAALRGTWGVLSNVALASSLPMSLTSMMLYAVSLANDCQYCSSIHKVTCKSVGIDEDTLRTLAENITELAPERVQAIVRFAVKCARTPQQLGEDDYAAVREAGLSDAELVEVVTIAGLAQYLDILADGLKLEVDSVIKDILGQA